MTSGIMPTRWATTLWFGPLGTDCWPATPLTSSVYAAPGVLGKPAFSINYGHTWAATLNGRTARIRALIRLVNGENGSKKRRMNLQPAPAEEILSSSGSILGSTNLNQVRSLPC